VEVGSVELGGAAPETLEFAAALAAAVPVVDPFWLECKINPKHAAKMARLAANTRRLMDVSRSIR
jgi:hypothetical protein